MKVLPRALRRNRRDLRIAVDPQQPAEARNDARQLLRRRRRAAARQIQKLQFHGVLLTKPLARLSHIAVRMTDAVVQLKILDPTPANVVRRRAARGALCRLSNSLAKVPKRCRDGWSIFAGWPAARGCLSRLHAAESAAVVSIAKQYATTHGNLLRPGPGRKSRSYAGGRQVRPRPRTPFVDVCLLVDSANDPADPRSAAQRLSHLVTTTQKLHKIQQAQERHLQTRRAVPDR